MSTDAQRGHFELLEALDQAHTAATRQTWAATDPERPWLVFSPYRLGPVADCAHENDAAAIVAAHSALPGLTAVARAVLELHHPWYEAGGVRHDNTVTVSCSDFNGCDGTADRWCAVAEDDGHEVLACHECRCVVDYDLDGFLLWPCPTVRAVTAALAPPATEPTEGAQA